MSQSLGTNLTAGVSPVIYVLTDANTNGLFVVASSPSATSGYAIGCLLIDPVVGKLYINTGTATAAVWTTVGSQS